MKYGIRVCNSVVGALGSAFASGRLRAVLVMFCFEISVRGISISLGWRRGVGRLRFDMAWVHCWFSRRGDQADFAGWCFVVVWWRVLGADSA